MSDPPARLEGPRAGGPDGARPDGARPDDTTFDAVVLAGGTARRLGGASKPDVELAGRRLLDHALDAATGARATVVVAPASVPVPPHVLRTLEDPPHGGPVAGIAAGLAALEARSGKRAAFVLVLACDVPGAASAVPALLRAGSRSTAGACLADAQGHPQWLVGVYRRAALHDRLTALEARAGTVRDAGVRALLAGLDLTHVAARGDEAADVDTWSDVDDLSGRQRSRERASTDVPRPPGKA